MANDFFEKYIFQFPKAWQFKIGDSIDIAVKSFAKENQNIISAIKGFVIGAITSMQNFLSAVPWIIIVIAVAILAWRLTKKKYTGLIYGCMLIFVGSCGLWSEMLQSISIIIASVILCIAIGFPVGILVSMSNKVSVITKPILDTMQTMPSWVYLVPAVMLFSTGITPALMATTIYAVVPMIRMTSHGLRYVDAEMLEAAKSFGSTAWQTLFKVQIPQALPTIMTGVNQTIMMSMSMVVTCALIGANGLGMEILIATNRLEMGKSLLPGLCIVIVAIILDRMTQSAVNRLEVKDNG